MNPNDKQEELLTPADGVPPASAPQAHDVQVPPAADVSPQGGVGAQLRAAREALGLSVSDAAHAIRLNPRQVQSLEDEAWDALPGPTFVRGFLRNYARFLRIDPAPLLAGLVRVEQPPLDVAGEDSTEETFEADPQRSGSLLLILGGALVVVALAVYFLLPAGTFEAPREVGAVSVPPAVTPSGQPADSAPVSPAGATDALPPAPDKGTAPESGPPTLAAPTASAPVAAPVRSAPAVAPTTAAAAAKPAPAAATPASAVAAAPVPAGPPIAVVGDASLPRVAVEGPERLIVFTVNELSWVEVLDAGGNQILANNLDAGRRRSVRGVAPLQVIIGNAAGIAVSVDGQAVDISPHTRANVTRLTVE